jgi:hypothetical protein
MHTVAAAWRQDAGVDSKPAAGIAVLARHIAHHPVTSWWTWLLLKSNKHLSPRLYAVAVHKKGLRVREHSANISPHAPHAGGHTAQGMLYPSPPSSIHLCHL